MRIDFERATIMALEIHASQQAVCTGTSMYSKPAASADCTTLSNSSSEDATCASALP